MAREAKKASTGVRKRVWLVLAVCVAGGASTAFAAIKVHRYFTTDPQFAISRDRQDAITIYGLRYASRARVQRVFADDIERSVFSVPLAERRRRLLAIDWVLDAAVSRVWPDRLVIRITEREPVAFVAEQYSVLLIDRYGMLLEVPEKANFAFPVLRGVRTDEPQAQRVEKVKTLLRLEDDLGPLMKDVSEVNVASADTIQMVSQVGDRSVELIVGTTNFRTRYANFLDHYSEIRKRSPDVRVFDLRLDDRITAKE